MQRLSFTTLSTPGLDVRAVAEFARRFGYDGVDLRVSAHMGEIKPGASRADIANARSVLDGEGVSAACLMSYIVYPENASVKDTVVSLREQAARELEIATVLGADAVRIGGGRSPDRAYTGELAEALAGLDITADIVIQNHVGAFSTVECLSVVDALGSPRVSLAFSPDHCVLMREDFARVHPLVKGKARKLFISDMKHADGEHVSVLPGLGIVPFLDSYRALGGETYDGWVTLKYEKLWEPSLEGPEVSLPFFTERAHLWFGGWRRT